MPTERILIYVEEETKDGYVFKGLLPQQLAQLTFRTSNRANLKPYKLEEILREKLPHSKLLEYYEQANAWSHREKGATLKKIMPIFKKKATKYYDGEYFAHEYNSRVRGKIRKIEFNNGYTVFEVRSKNREYDVFDDFWDEEDRYGIKHTNGCGDHFIPFETPPWVK